MPNQACGNPSQCEGFETTKTKWTHTVSPFLAFVLLPHGFERIIRRFIISTLLRSIFSYRGER